MIKFGMKSTCRGFILFLFTTSWVYALDVASVPVSSLLRGGWLFDGITDGRRPNQGILIREGKIAAIDFNKEIPPGVTIIELDESETIIPGMFDLHAHYNLDLIDKGRVEEVEYNGVIFLANGVTSTWSAGEFYPERVIAQRDLIQAHKAIGPRLFISGPYFGAFRCEYKVKVAEGAAGAGGCGP